MRKTERQRVIDSLREQQRKAHRRRMYIVWSILIVACLIIWGIAALAIFVLVSL